MKRVNAQLEKQLIREHINRAVITARNSTIVCMVLFVLFSFFDKGAVPQATRIALAVRFGVVIPCILVLFLMTFFSGFMRYFQLFVSIMMFITGAGMLVILFLSKPGSMGFFLYVILLNLLIMIIYLFPRYRLQYALIIAGIITVSFLTILSMAFFNTGNGDLLYTLITVGSVIIGTNITGAMISRAHNKFFSIDFMFQRKLYSAYDNLQITYERVQEDLQIAKKIQKNILPSGSHQIEGLALRVYYQPFHGISGDFYDIAEVEPGYTRIFIADATGHGIQAALITMIIKSEYEMIKDQKTSVSSLLEQLNRNFIHAYSSLETYFSCFILDIDLKNNRIYYSSAGHPEQLLLAGDRTVQLSGGGLIMGDIATAEYRTHEEQFSPGDKILVFTDGLYERVDEESEIALKQLLEHNIEINRKEQLDKIFASILTTLDMFDQEMGSDSRHDDITIIGIEYQA